MSEAMRMSKVTVRPATILPHSRMPIHGTVKRRVAAYARVSTGSEEQLTSYEAQLRHYSEYIQSRGDWTFVHVYADEGLSGLRLKKRDDFNQMIADALDGKIDLILAKSISRFARNTVDTLNMVRTLKAHGVEVYFEKENIYTFDAKGELLITIMASLAQEESRSISENVKWGVRAKFANGEFSLPYARFLGYRKGADGKPEIIPEEAEIVRMIYRLYLSGWTTLMIAGRLTEEGIPTPGGKTKWPSSTIESILSNEKYCGDAILQKTFTLDFLQGTKKINEGEVPQYHQENSHDAIVSKAIFHLVQQEAARRAQIGRSYSGKDPFSCRVVCGECAGLYGGKVWYSGTKYRRTIYRCNRKYEKGTAVCATPHFGKDDIKSAFLKVYNRALQEKVPILDACREALDRALDTGSLAHKIDALQKQADELATLIRAHITANASKSQDQAKYSETHAELTGRLDATNDTLAARQEQLESLKLRRYEIEAYLGTLEQTGELLTEFDPLVWNFSVDTMTVGVDGAMVFRFKDGETYIYR